MICWIFGSLLTSRGSNRDSNRRPLRSALNMHCVQWAGYWISKANAHCQSGSRFEPGLEIQNRGSNRQLGYSWEFDFRRTLDRNNEILD